MRYRLRTLLIVLAIMPPIIRVGYIRWQRYRDRQSIMRLLQESSRRVQAFRDLLNSPSPNTPNDQDEP